MRLLRALALFVLALVVTIAPVAHARAVAGMGVAHESHAVASHAGMSHAAHDCDDRGSGHPVQTSDACQMACCFLPAHVPTRADVIRTAVFSTVRYADWRHSCREKPPRPITACPEKPESWP